MPECPAHHCRRKGEGADTLCRVTPALPAAVRGGRGTGTGWRSGGRCSGSIPRTRKRQGVFRCPTNTRTASPPWSQTAMTSGPWGCSIRLWPRIRPENPGTRILPLRELVTASPRTFIAVMHTADGRWRGGFEMPGVPGCLALSRQSLYVGLQMTPRVLVEINRTATLASIPPLDHASTNVRHLMAAAGVRPPRRRHRRQRVYSRSETIIRHHQRCVSLAVRL